MENQLTKDDEPMVDVDAEAALAKELDETEAEEGRRVLSTWSNFVRVVEAKRDGLGTETAIHQSSILSRDKLGLARRMLNQDPAAIAERPVPKSIKDFLASQKLLPAQATSTAASPAASNDPSILWKASEEAEAQARQYVSEKAAHEHTIHYLYTRVAAADNSAAAVAAEQAASVPPPRPNPYVVKAKYANKVLYAEAFRPFEPCKLGTACFFANIGITRSDGSLPKIIQMIPPHKWKEYLKTGQRPDNLPEMCFVDMCLCYNYNRDLGKPSGVRNDVQPKFTVLTDLPNGYRTLACRETVVTPSSPAGVGQSDALTVALRHPMATDFYESSTKLPMMQLFPDGRPPAVTMESVRSWRERADLIFTDGSRSDTMRLVNPATQLRVDMKACALEDVIRLFIENHRKQTLLRETLPAALQKFIEKTDQVREKQSNALASSWFNRADFSVGVERWIASLRAEERPVIDARTGFSCRSALAAKDMYELRKDFEALINGIFNKAAAAALSMYNQNNPMRDQIATFVALVRQKSLTCVSEKYVRSLEDGFLGLSDIAFRTFKKSLSLFDPDTFEPEDDTPESRAYRASYLEHQLPEDLYEDAGFRYFGKYVSFKDAPEVELLDHYIYYMVLIRANTAEHLLTELVRPALLKPGGTDAASTTTAKKGVSFDSASSWRGQEEYYRELKNIETKLTEFNNSHLPLMQWFQARINTKLPLSDASVMQEGFFWRDLCPQMEGVHAPEDRKYVQYKSHIECLSTPHGEVLTYLQKTCPERERLLAPSTHHRPAKEMTTLYSFFNTEGDEHELVKQVPKMKHRLKLHRVEEGGAVIALDMSAPHVLTVPIEHLFRDFDECRVWCVDHLPRSGALLLDSMGFSSWPKKRLIPPQLWRDIDRVKDRLYLATHSIVLTLLLRIYVARCLADFEKDVLASFLSDCRLSLPCAADTVKDGLAAFKLMNVTKRTAFLLQRDPDALEPLAGDEKALMLDERLSALLSDIDGALRLSRNFVYQLSMFGWDHCGLLDAVCTFEGDEDTALGMPVPSDATLCAPNERLQCLSSYEVYYPDPKSCLCGDNLVDCAKPMSKIRFISDVSSMDPFVKGITKVQPGVCQIREMVRTNLKIVRENVAYRGYAYQALACMLIGGYRDSTVRLGPADTVLVMRWIQTLPAPDGIMYLIAQALRENSTMHLRNNPSFHDAVLSLFPLYHNFECKRVPESVNGLRRELISAIGPDYVGLDIGPVIAALAKKAEEGFKDKSIEVFRRPRVDCLRHLCKCFKSSCIERYTGAYVEHITRGGDINVRPEFGPMPTKEHQDAIVHYVRTLDPRQASNEIASLRKIGVGEKGIAQMMSVFKMFLARRSDDEMTNIMNGMDMRDLLLSYFFYYMLRYQDTISLIPLPQKMAAAMCTALHDRFSVPENQPLPNNVTCLYFCSPLLGCGRMMTAVAQQNGPGAYGNDYMSMDWDKGVLVCRPKRTNKSPQKKASTRDSKAPKAAQRYVACLAKHEQGAATKKLDDLRAATVSAVKKDFRRVIRTLFKRPCDKASCVPVSTLGNLVQTCEVKEKKVAHEHTFCPKRGCGAATIFSTDMIDSNEQRENFRRPSCMACNKILLTQHGDELLLAPILAREPFMPLPIRKGTALGFCINGVTATNRRFNAKRRKKRTVRPVGQAPDAEDEDEDADTAVAAAKPRRRRGVATAASVLTKVNKKRRTDPVALQETTPAAAAAVKTEPMTIPASLKRAMKGPASLFEDAEMAEVMTETDSETSVGDDRAHVKQEPGTIGGYGISQLYSPFTGQKKSALAGHKRGSAASKRSSELPTWRFYALLDVEEGRVAPCWLCDACNIDWLADYEDKITKQELLHLIRSGSLVSEKARNFLYSLERP